jgi:hypothetical protein
VVDVGVIARSFPCAPLRRAIVEDDDGDVVGAVPVQHAPLASNDALYVRLQARVERRPNLPGFAAGREHHFDEMRSLEGGGERDESKPFGASGRGLLVCEQTLVRHPREDRTLAFERW